MTKDLLKWMEKDIGGDVPTLTLKLDPPLPTMRLKACVFLYIHFA